MYTLIDFSKFESDQISKDIWFRIQLQTFRVPAETLTPFLLTGIWDFVKQINTTLVLYLLCV